MRGEGEKKRDTGRRERGKEDKEKSFEWKSNEERPTERWRDKYRGI